MKLEIKTTDEDVLAMFEELPEETKQAILDRFTATEVINQLTKHIKGGGDYYGWSTSGWRWGSEVREALAKMNGFEEELRKDHKNLVSSLTHDRDYYRKYYNWYFEFYHLDHGEIHNKVVERIGEPNKEKKDHAK